MLTAALVAGLASQDCLAGYSALPVYIALPKAPRPQHYGVAAYHVEKPYHAVCPAQGKVSQALSQLAGLSLGQWGQHQPKPPLVLVHAAELSWACALMPRHILSR